MHSPMPSAAAARLSGRAWFTIVVIGLVGQLAWTVENIGRVLALSEYGGYSLAVPEHTWGPRTFGYRKYRTRGRLESAFVRLHDDEIVPAVRRGLAAVVYTQLSDVEDEDNGLVTYDRRVVKIDEAAVRAVNARISAAAKAAAGAAAVEGNLV